MGRDAVVSPLFIDSTPAVTALGFPVSVRTKLAFSLITPNGTRLRGHEPLYCSSSSQALLQAFPSPGGTRRSASPFGALRVWVSNNKFTAQTTRGFDPESGLNFLPDPPQKARHRRLGAGPSAFCALSKSGAQLQR
jgi:hypothetical protein